VRNNAEINVKFHCWLYRPGGCCKDPAVKHYTHAQPSPGLGHEAGPTHGYSNCLSRPWPT